MDLIKTGIGLTKTIRNVGRLREIVSIFARNGFDEFLSSGIADKIPNFVLPKSRKRIKEELDEQGEQNWHQVIGNRLRLCFEELGPAFIKFGQLLSSREDLFDEGFIDEMKKLRDKVKGIPIEVARQEIETALGKSIDEVFESIDPNPVGNASIGVVYKGKLKDGGDVVIKVRRPNIESMIETDFSIMITLVSQIERASAEIRYLGISRVLKDFAVTLQNELNFHVEAMNCNRFKESLYARDKDKIFHIPKIYDEYTCENILVMEFLHGTPFSEPEKIDCKAIAEKLDTGLEYFIKSILKDGFFHADLHGGNFFYLDDGKIGIIDFGLMGTLGRKSRQNFLAILYAMLTYNYENLVYEFLDVAEYEQIPDVDQLITDVRDALSPYVGLTVQQTNYSNVFKAIISTLNKHQIYLPREWFVVFRALISMDGVGKSLGIDFDIFGLLDKDIREILNESFSKDDLIEEAVWAARDIVPALRIFPRHLKWFLKDLAKKNYAFEIVHRGHEKELSLIGSSLYFIGFAFLGGILVMTGVSTLGDVTISHWSQVPLLTWIFWGLGLMTIVRGSFYLSNK